MRRIGCALILYGALASPTLAADAALKAVFVQKLLGFVQWPEGAQPSQRLCAVVPDIDWSAFSALDGQGGLGVSRLTRDGSINDCSVVYLGEMPAAEFAQWVRRVEREPVLSVCENWRCARDGAMIGLGVEDSRLYFEANTSAINRAGLRVGARLLRLARTVY